MYQHYEFENVPLPYDYSALEPYIDTKTMELHHDKHLQTYVNNLNAALKNYPSLHTWSLEKLIYNANSLPKEIRTAVVNNGGGVYNHNFYFAGMANSEIKSPIGNLSYAIDKVFGSFDGFKSMFKQQALSVFGSGYAWLVMDRNCNLKIITTANQGTPLVNNLCPILNIDVWEHAYYLKHYNKRADYIDDWFQVVNWEKADEKYMKCKMLCNAKSR
jgi:Fe-Mn family superoxide dismutase